MTDTPRYEFTEPAPGEMCARMTAEMLAGRIHPPSIIVRVLDDLRTVGAPRAGQKVFVVDTAETYVYDPDSGGSSPWVLVLEAPQP